MTDKEKILELERTNENLHDKINRQQRAITDMILKEEAIKSEAIACIETANRVIVELMEGI